jgi:hypothetical protein
MNSMGIGIGDFNRDGCLDLALSNIGPNKLLRNDCDGTFTEVGARARVARGQQQADQRSVTWGVSFGDFNLDGWEDLYFAAGALVNSDLSEAPQRNELFVNDGPGSFLDLSAPSGAADPGQSRGVAVADFDRDGRLDMLVLDQDGTPHLYRNVTPRGGRHWLEVDTVGTASNRDGCGARLVATPATGPPIVREVFCGSTSVASGSDRIAHFGLGGDAVLRKLEIDWPSGIRQVLGNVRADRVLQVREPAR